MDTTTTTPVRASKNDFTTCCLSTITVLPIERCSRRIVQQLKQAGYDLEYREFNGFHTVPTAIAQRAMECFTQSAPDKVFHL